MKVALSPAGSRSVIFIFALLVAGIPAHPAFAQTRPGTKSESSDDEFLLIAPGDASAHLGRKVRMKFTVQAVGRGGPGAKIIELNSMPSYKVPGNVHVLITPEVAAEFVKSGIPAPDRFFRMREIEVTGVLKERKPGGFLVPALELQSISDLRYSMESDRPSIAVSQLKNRRVDVYLNSGRSFANVLISDVEFGSHPEGFVSIRGATPDGKTSTYRALTIRDLTFDGVPLDLTYDAVRKESAVDQVKRETRIRESRENELRLASQGFHLHPRRTDAEQQQSLKQNQEFAESVKAFFPELPIRTLEREYFLVVTDIPSERGDVHFQYLDELYDEMCKSFGV
ncbi:MAG: hypothetical protein KDA96_22250, partial [Planctomycetaceae bacterium]|nr:hypothetical protein [Planctomycetaceae bacterium]